MRFFTVLFRPVIWFDECVKLNRRHQSPHSEINSIRHLIVSWPAMKYHQKRKKPKKHFTIQILNYVQASGFWRRQIHRILEVLHWFMIHSKNSLIFKMKQTLNMKRIIESPSSPKYLHRIKRYRKPTKCPSELIWISLKWKLIHSICHSIWWVDHQCLFSLIAMNHALVTEIRKLIGVVALKKFSWRLRFGNRLIE